MTWFAGSEGSRDEVRESKVPATMCLATVVSDHMWEKEQRLKGPGRGGWLIAELGLSRDIVAMLQSVHQRAREPHT